MTDLTIAKATLEELHAQGTTLSEKLTAAQTEEISLAQQHDNASATLETTERAHILDQVSDKVLLAAQQAHSDLAAKLTAVNRRITLIREAIAGNDLKIAAAAQSLKIARRDFCVEESFKILEKIKQNNEFKGLILGAMAAFAANGQCHYTNNARKFMTDNIERILPEVTETEAREATETFQKINGLG